MTPAAGPEHGVRRFLSAAVDVSFERHTPWFFRVRRYLRRCRRALFGSRLPHWATGMYRFFRWANLLELVPTFAVPIFNPWHFYRRLPQVLAEGKPWYKTPLPFFATQAAYAILLFKHLAPLQMQELTTDLVHGWFANSAWLSGNTGKVVLEQGPNLLLAAIALSAPLWMLLVALLMYFVTLFYEFCRLINERTPLVRQYPYPILNPYLYLVPLDPRAYLRLQWPRFWWGLFYFGLIAAATVGVFGVVLVVLEFVFSDPSEGTPGPAYPIFIGLVLWAFQRILITPYVSILRCAGRAPTRLMHQSDAYVIIELLETLARRDPSKWSTRFMLNRASIAWDRYRGRANPEKLDLRRTAPDALQTSVGCQKQAFNKFDPSLKWTFRAIPQKSAAKVRVERMLLELAEITAPNSAQPNSEPRASSATG